MFSRQHRLQKSLRSWLFVSLVAISPVSVCLAQSAVGTSSSSDAGWLVQWGYQQALDRFFSEGIATGDINRDTHQDLVVGPFWIEGPEFTKRHRIQAGEPVDPHGYAPHFFSFTDDFNGDGRTDILHIGFPGEATYWLEQPEDLTSEWKRHDALAVTDNESPTYVDIDGDGRRDLICSSGGRFGYATINPDKPDDLWTFHAVSPEGVAGGRFTHGLGVGDINGDGRLDLLEKNGWWEQPETLADDALWVHHRVPFSGPGGSQMYAHDFDGDGDADVVTALAAHGYGLAWYEQQIVAGERQFIPHLIVGQTPSETEFGTVFSQPHAVTIVDIDGDGLMDIVSGKRPWAHGPHGDPEPLGSPVLYWFQCQRTPEGHTHFVPRLVSDQSGVGVDIVSADINGDGWPDIVSANKRGVFIHRQDRVSVDGITLARSNPVSRSEAAKAKPAADRPTSGLEPVEAAAQFTAPEGFEVDLVAGEPDLHQPIAFCFDSRGRIWVAEAHTYPTRAPEGQGRDLIRIFEDTNGDGTFDSKKTFAEGLNLVSGIQVGYGGVWVGAAPYLMFIPDQDGDDRPDSAPQILLDGFGFQDTHETLNAFTWGPDGWLYGCQGVFTHSKIGKPGSPDSERTAMNAGVWRYHPVRHEFEVFAHGTSNPWGVTFDEHGQAFITACVIPHAYHMIQGGRYQRQAGQHFDPYTFDDIKTIADHAHYAGNIADHAWWGRDEAVEDDATSAAGGGHAHCGALVYLGDNWPTAYRGALLMHNLHGNRINVDLLRGDGTGFIASHGSDLLFANDPWYRGIALQTGPDGCVYLIDWYDKNACHRTSPEIWDRTNGRMYRLRYGNLESRQENLANASAERLVDLHSHENAWHVETARRVLIERAASGQDLQATRGKLLVTAMGPGAVDKRLDHLWTAHGIAPLSPEESLVLLGDPQPFIRAWTIQLVCETGLPTPAVLERLVQMAKTETAPQPRLYLASALQRLTTSEAENVTLWDFATGLASHGDSQFDRNLPLMVWYAVNPLVAANPEQGFQLAKSTAIPRLREFIYRRAASDPAMVGALVSAMAAEEDAGLVKGMLAQLAAAAPKLGKIQLPAAWPKVVERFSTAEDGDLRRSLQTLSVTFGDASAFPLLRELAATPSNAEEMRREALETLARGSDPQLQSLALRLLDDPQLASDAIALLARFDGEDVARAILQRYPKMSPPLRRASLDTLASRLSHASLLLDAIEKKEIARTDLSAVHASKLRQLGSEKLSERLTELWGIVGSTPEEAAEEIADLQAKYTSDVLASASPSNGRLLYNKSCGQCHRLFGEGSDIGPDLTGANRSNLTYLLENIIAPNAIVGKDYQAITVLTLDGRVITGLAREQTDAAITLHDAEKLVTIPRSEIDEVSQTARSVMPEGILKPFSENEIADLLAYLQATSQVPLGADVKISDVSGRAEGVIEGESLADVKVSAGTAVSQGMAGFPASRWSGASQLWWTGAKPNATMEFKVDIPEDGQYEIVAAFTKAPDYGVISVSIGRQSLISGLDLYAAGRVVSTGPLLLGEVDLKSGEAPVLIEIQGANPAAVKRFMVGVDYFLVKKAQ